MALASYIVTGLLAAIFLKAGIEMSVARPPQPETAERLGVPLARWRLIGALELAGMLGLLAGPAWLPIGWAAAIGLILLMIGAIVTHRRAGDAIAMAAPAWICLAGSVAYLALLR